LQVKYINSEGFRRLRKIKYVRDKKINKFQVNCSRCPEINSCQRS